MPTSAAGSSRCCGRLGSTRHRIGGFTLLELLVVIAIIALATAGVGFALRDSGSARIDREAERLAALLESARAQSRANGVVVSWRLTPQGPADFSFDGLPIGTLPNAWLAEGISAQPLAADGSAIAALLLGPDPIIPAQQVLLTADGTPPHSLRIGTDGLRPFAVISP
jgi:general secretion pathway protein H